MSGTVATVAACCFIARDRAPPGLAGSEAASLAAHGRSSRWRTPARGITPRAMAIAAPVTPAASRSARNRGPAGGGACLAWVDHAMFMEWSLRAAGRNVTTDGSPPSDDCSCASSPRCGRGWIWTPCGMRSTPGPRRAGTGTSTVSRWPSTCSCRRRTNAADRFGGCGNCGPSCLPMSAPAGPRPTIRACSSRQSRGLCPTEHGGRTWRGTGAAPTAAGRRSTSGSFASSTSSMWRPLSRPHGPGGLRLAPPQPGETRAPGATSASSLAGHCVATGWDRHGPRPEGQLQFTWWLGAGQVVDGRGQRRGPCGHLVASTSKAAHLPG